ncbi:MAG: trypsin-like serine protease [Pseudomonadota bacterium]
MTLKPGLIALLACALLPACDAVRVPGDEPQREPDAPGTEAPLPAQDQTSSEGQTPPPALRAATSVAGETPGTPPLEPGVDPAPELPAPLVTNLAQINAASCGLPETAEPTPTLAEFNEAAEIAPQAESFLQTQVVGVSLAVASLDLFPGIVKMEPVNYDAAGNESRGHCGATRIADQWFLTAAHCIDDGYQDIRFIAGTVNVRDTDSANIFVAESAICHAGYDGLDTAMINDIALIKVSDATLPNIRNIPIASYGAPNENFSPENYEMPVMAGWGSTSYGSSPSSLLLSTQVKLVSSSPGVILVESVGGSGPCQGDSGGPLYVREDDGQQRVVGVLSNVQSPRGQTPCAGEYRGQYTNVAGYVDWIDNVVAACGANDVLCRN